MVATFENEEEKEGGLRGLMTIELAKIGGLNKSRPRLWPRHCKDEPLSNFRKHISINVQV